MELNQKIPRDGGGQRSPACCSPWLTNWITTCSLVRASLSMEKRETAGRCPHMAQWPQAVHQKIRLWGKTFVLLGNREKQWEHWVLGASAHGPGLSSITAPHSRILSYYRERGSTPLCPSPHHLPASCSLRAPIWPIPCGGKSPLTQDLSQSSTCHQHPGRKNATWSYYRYQDATHNSWIPERSLAEEWDVRSLDHFQNIPFVQSVLIMSGERTACSLTWQRGPHSRGQWSLKGVIRVKS